MEENETKYYVCRTNCYGLRPHVNYTVTLADGTTATTETPTLAALTEAMPSSGYVVQADVAHVIEELASTSQTTLTDEDKLTFAKEMLAREIAVFDDKPKGEVNVFYLGQLPMWFTYDRRMAIKNGVESSQTMGRTNYTIYDDDTGLSVSVSCETALQILAALEVYALDCLSTTNKHKAAVKALATVDEVAAYDYKSGYPDKLTFTL
jgi:hypothetical protein